MPIKPKTKTTVVRTHPRKVRPTNKNPQGVTIVDRHLRRLPGTYLDEKEIYKIVNGYSLKKIKYPSKNKLKYENEYAYDQLIAIWADYFTKLFNLDRIIDLNMIKALIASESSFEPSADNGIAYGLAQITKQTLKIIQDPNGEVKDFIFTDIRQKDLKNPDIAIPMAVRWLAHKQRMAERRLKQKVTSEEIILEYKGLTKSKTDYAATALKNYRKYYAILNKK